MRGPDRQRRSRLSAARRADHIEEPGEHVLELFELTGRHDRREGKARAPVDRPHAPLIRRSTGIHVWLTDAPASENDTHPHHATSSNAGSRASSNATEALAAGHDSGVVALGELEAEMAAAFVETGRTTTSWPDPHPVTVPDEAYERLTSPAKWQILSARADAWVAALTAAGLATVERRAAVRWTEPPGPVISRSERVTPTAAGAVELVVAHSRMGGIDDTGIVLGVGDPAERIALIPSCGCDACDHGSQVELDAIDGCFRAVVTGAVCRWADGSLVLIGGDIARSVAGAGGPRSQTAATFIGEPWLDLGNLRGPVQDHGGDPAR